jgi:hypothetical protein
MLSTDSDKIIQKYSYSTHSSLIDYLAQVKK